MSRWEDNIKMDLREIQWEVVDWMHPAHDRGQCWDSCEHGNEPSGSIKGGVYLDKLLKKDSALWRDSNIVPH
jgi:hypothetical protein